MDLVRQHEAFEQSLIACADRVNGLVYNGRMFAQHDDQNRDKILEKCLGIEDRYSGNMHRVRELGSQIQQTLKLFEFFQEVEDHLPPQKHVTTAVRPDFWSSTPSVCSLGHSLTCRILTLYASQQLTMAT
ncbi:unnamed protein product [Protopolystoma xenopodis]|uniref:Uncharacterized protein n=1 Tax=Protopolystoma xenopodis TaxID=117903 RepID=A0A448WC98_9PLAT|nr:unnamed protein product [Protopolystoma xenopodis]